MGIFPYLCSRKQDKAIITMALLKITSDPNNVLEGKKITEIGDLFRTYKKHASESKYNYCTRIPMPSAIEIMTEELGIKVQYL